MLCRVEMPANEEIFGRFYRYKMLHMQKGRGLLVFPLVAVLLCIMLFVAGVPPLFLILVLVMVAAYLVYSLYLRPASAFRQKEGGALMREVTIISQNGVQRNVKSEEGGIGETSSMQFSALDSAIETKRDFYLFTSPAEAWLLDKEYFTNGTPEELRALLSKAMGNKFKSKA